MKRSAIGALCLSGLLAIAWMADVSVARAQELTAAEHELVARTLGDELVRIAEESGSPSGDAVAVSRFQDLAEQAAVDLDRLGTAVATDRNSDATRDAYAATLSALIGLLRAAQTLDLDVTEAEVAAVLQSLRDLAPTPARTADAESESISSAY